MDILTICNNALGEISAAFITDLQEASVEAENCRRLYPQVVQDALEWDEDGFEFATRRAALAVVSNDRQQEWTFAYVVPADMGKPLRIIKYDPTAAAVSYPEYGPYPFPSQIAFGDIPFEIANRTIYTNVEAAWFEYVLKDVSPSVMSAAFRRAIELELAARLVMPIRKKVELRAEVAKLAGVSRQFAIAENRNRRPVLDTHVVTARDYARAGYGLDVLV